MEQDKTKEKTINYFFVLLLLSYYLSLSRVRSTYSRPLCGIHCPTERPRTYNSAMLNSTAQYIYEVLMLSTIRDKQTHDMSGEVTVLQ